MNTITYFEIQTSNPEKAISFYTSVFGWSIEKDETMSTEYYTIETDDLIGGLLPRPADAPPTGTGANAFVCSIQVDSFDKASKKIQKAGGKVALQKFAIPGRCWQGYFLDPDNNTFGIFQVDSAAK
jgi:predicted enzyme related to lactoylglutathione lyase